MSRTIVKFHEKRRHWYVDTHWPDGVRTRPQMPDEKTAIRINQKIELAIYDEERIWKALRRSLNMERSGAELFDAFADLYLEQYVKLYNRDVQTKESRLSILKRYLGKTRISKFSSQAVTAFIAARKAEGIGNRTINRDLLVLVHMLSWGVEQELLTENPLPSIQRLKEVEWVGPRPDEKLVDQVFAKLDPSALPIFSFIRDTGCRREEAIILERDQVDFPRSEVVFHGKTKNGRARRVPLTSSGLWAVSALPRIGARVFYHPRHLQPWDGDSLSVFWERARNLAELSWMRIHDLRHAYGIKLAEEGCPMHHISYVLGHHSVDFTAKVYARFSPESSSRAVLVALSQAKTGTQSAQPKNG